MQDSQRFAQPESKTKCPGSKNEESKRLYNASVLDGEDRADAEFNIVEVVSEFRAQRASVLRHWCVNSQLGLDDIDDMIRFSEAMDQSLTKVVSSYPNRIKQSLQMVLAILSHDLRHPLNCIRMAATLISQTNDDPVAAKALAAIETNSEAIVRLSSDLIDFASTGLGNQIPLTRGPVDLERLCREVIEKFRYTHPHRTLDFHPDGDLTGNWDEARLRQVISNLISNALQHGSNQGPVELSVASEKSNVVVSMRNEGAPLPPGVLTTIFDPLLRYTTVKSAVRRVPGCIGLGLYIVREIVVAHGGTIRIDSTAQEGTTLTVRLPR